MFVVILITDIRNREELQRVSGYMDKLSEVNHWDTDLEDPEHVMRIYMSANVLPQLGKVFRSLGFIFSVLNIYHTGYGVEHPAFDEIGGAAPTSLGYMVLQNFLDTTTGADL